jgi:Uncharacterized alpha/beta hydrolase domain (DUF2235)
MGKNIVLLSDGTGNSAAKFNKTNVWRVYRALDLTADDQIAEYDDGVGTSSFRPLALIGGAFGVGLARNVRRLYAFLSRNYRGPDDRVFAFGFSRGAYTIRMLIGLVRNQGLIKPDLPEQLFQREVLHRWDAFRSERFSKLNRTPDPQPERHEVETRGRVPEFEFVGLWDTVAAYGLPIDELQHAIDLYIYRFSFSDRHLSSIVKCAYHALSLDDERRTFHPVLWDESDPNDRTRIQQVWFPGVHSNVGGGYPKDGLAYLSLEWMVTKAKTVGLRFLDADFTEIKQQIDPYDDLYDSRAGLGGYYCYGPRPVTTLCDDTLNGVKIERPKIHESAFERISGGRVAYAPIGIPCLYDMALRDGSIVRRPVTEVHDANGGTIAAKADDTPKSCYFEEADQAQLRATRMEAVWNVVWCRRVVYFLTLFSSVYLVSLPALTKVLSTRASLPSLTATLEQYLKPILTATGYLVPNWVGNIWLLKFDDEPLLFLIGVVCVAVTMLIGSSLEETIRSRAGEIWHASWCTVPNWAVDPKSTWLYKLRSNPSVITAYRYFAWRALPTICLAACAGLAAWLCWNSKCVTIYGALLMLGVAVRNWVFRAQYWAGKRRSLSTDRQSSQNDFPFPDALGAKARSPL